MTVAKMEVTKTPKRAPKKIRAQTRKSEIMKAGQHEHDNSYCDQAYGLASSSSDVYIEDLGQNKPTNDT